MNSACAIYNTPTLVFFPSLLFPSPYIQSCSFFPPFSAPPNLSTPPFISTTPSSPSPSPSSSSLFHASSLVHFVPLRKQRADAEVTLKPQQLQTLFARHDDVYICAFKMMQDANFDAMQMNEGIAADVLKFGDK